MDGSRSMSLDSIVDTIAVSRPDSEACLEAFDEMRSFSYSSLGSLSKRLAHGLRTLLVAETGTTGLLVPAVAISMARGFHWYATYVALIRLGVPVAPMDQDIADKQAQMTRNRDIVHSIGPRLIVIDETTPATVLEIGFERGVTYILFNDLLAISDRVCDVPRLYDIETTPLAYLYTGGTTRANKCAIISHHMAMHEMVAYPIVAPNVNHRDRVIQHSSTYWGATFLGQINIALAFGASVVFCENQTDLSEVIERAGISVLGLVPSQLGALSGPCRTVKTVFTWGEKMSKSISSKWKKKCALIELLVSTEYWLCLYALNGEDSFHIVNLPTVDIRMNSLAGKTGQELLIGGACVTPWGYTDPEFNQGIFQILHNGKRYFKSSDLVQVLNGGSGLRFVGRSDSMIKIGGEWKDLFIIQENLSNICGVEDASILPPQRVGGSITAFVVLSSRVSEVTINEIRRNVNENYIAIQYVAYLPRNAITGKVDRHALASLIAANDIDYSTSSRSQLRIRKVIIHWLMALSATLLGFALIAHVNMIQAICIAPYISLALFYVQPTHETQKKWMITNIWYSIVPICCVFIVLLEFGWPIAVAISVIALIVCQSFTTMYLKASNALPTGSVGIALIMASLIGLGLRIFNNSLCRSGFFIIAFVHSVYCAKLRSLNHFVAWFITFWIGLPRQLERIEWQDYIPSFSKQNTRRGYTPLKAFRDTNHSNRVVKMWTDKDMDIEKKLSSFLHETMIVSESEASRLGKSVSDRIRLNGNPNDPEIRANTSSPCNPEVLSVVDSVCQFLPRPVGASTLLTSLNSLAAVELTNHLRDTTGKNIHVADVLNCVTISDLCSRVDVAELIPIRVEEKSTAKEWRCQLWGWGFPCAWIFELSKGHSWIHYKSLQIAIKELCLRHPSLLARSVDPKPLSYWMNETLVVVGLARNLLGNSWIVRAFGWCVYESWNRVQAPADRDMRIGWKRVSTELELREYLLEKKRKGNFYPPTEVDVIVLNDSKYYVRLYVTHAFTDGSCIVPLLKDLNELYLAAVERRDPKLSPPAPSAFAIQEKRLWESLTDPKPDSFYLCYNMDMDEGSDLASFGRILVLDQSFVFVAIAASHRLAVPIDVLLLSAIASALARLWHWTEVVEMALVVPLRDGPHEAEVVGFLADQRNIDIPLMGKELTTLASVVQTIHSLRRKRGWKIPAPFTNCERTLVNIVQANFPENACFRQELALQQHEAATGTLYRPMELYVEQIEPHMWTLKARCRLREYSSEKFTLFCELFKQAVFEMIESPNTRLHK